MTLNPADESPVPEANLEDPDGYSITYTDDGQFHVLDRRDWHEVGVYPTRAEAVRAALDEPIPRWSAKKMRLKPSEVEAIVAESDTP